MHWLFLFWIDTRNLFGPGNPLFLDLLPKY